MFRRRHEREVEHPVHEDRHKGQDGQGQEGRQDLQRERLGGLERLLHLLRSFAYKFEVDLFVM